MMKFEFFRLETSVLFDELIEYHKKMELQLGIMQQNEQEQLHSQAKAEAWDEVEFFAMQDTIHKSYDFTFPRHLRYSFIVLLFLVLENQLNGLCDEVQKRKNLPISVSELKGGLIERTKTYLQKLAGTKDVDWAYIEDLSKIRNCIVHALGRVNLSRDKKHLRKIALRKEGLEISDDEFGEEGVLLVSGDYCSQAVQNVKMFFDKVFDSAGFGPAMTIT